AVASRSRPVVLVIDDLQWAGSTPLNLLDALLSGEEEVEGLLTVCAFRDSEVDPAHPLAPRLARWQDDSRGFVHLHLDNLDPPDLATMGGEMVHTSRGARADLAAAVFGLTGGNPYETLELLNGLRREGLLRATD